jgi:hypothetical protein
MRKICSFTPHASHLYYLASPYSHADLEVMRTRADVVTKAAVDLLRQNIFVFAPIAYNAPWEKYHLPSDWTFWQYFDKTFISRSDAIVVLQIDGWEKSVGIAAEIEFAEQSKIPVLYVTLEQIETGDLGHLDPEKVLEDTLSVAVRIGATDALY